MERRPPAALPEHAKPVRVVNHDAGTTRLGEPNDLRQVDDVAAHREHAVDHHESPALVRHAVEARLEVGHVVVLEPQELAVAQLAASVDARVVLAVADHVVVHADERAYYAGVRLETRAESERRFPAKELRDFLLKLDVQVESAVQEARAGTASAVFLDRLYAGLHHVVAYRKPKIVV